ncbi:MAG: hypothetical protein R2874_10945 [Desulfobacterales bacterium]
MGYSAREVDLVAFLIENHLLLIKIATRRDINDEETAIACARQIQDENRLRMYLTSGRFHGYRSESGNSLTRLC